MSLEFFEALKLDFDLAGNSCIYTLPVTTWLMVMQRLSPGGKLADAVNELVHGNGRELLTPCKRVRERKISSATGGYSQARKRIPSEAARRVAQRTFRQLHRVGAGSGLAGRVFLLDGSSVLTACSSANAKAFPPARNQHGESHFPVLRVCVMHHLTTGLAMAPQFGPMYGSKAASEQGLAELLIDQLPDHSILIADRNFGVFSVVWHASRGGHQLLVRMTGQRAHALCGGAMKAGDDRKVVWRPSRDDVRAHPTLNGSEQIEGRLIATYAADGKEILYLFTTLEEPAESIAELYKQRWNIETDLRSLKEQLRLHSIQARSPQLVATELFMAIAAYNLIRAVMTEAATQIGAEPRRLSFSRCRSSFWAFAHATANVTSQDEFESRWKVLLRSFGQCKLPKRNRPPAPRAIWHKRQNFPSRKVH
ncbi:MAG TPA: IS4 family transposase [Acidobacteriaceae bacterium]|nr:IS4 family transposase [Acidobacteriaceae bacterium]